MENGGTHTPCLVTPGGHRLQQREVGGSVCPLSSCWHMTLSSLLPKAEVCSYPLPSGAPVRARGTHRLAFGIANSSDEQGDQL